MERMRWNRRLNAITIVLGMVYVLADLIFRVIIAYNERKGLSLAQAEEVADYHHLLFYAAYGVTILVGVVGTVTFISNVIHHDAVNWWLRIILNLGAIFLPFVHTMNWWFVAVEVVFGALGGYFLKHYGHMLAVRKSGHHQNLMF